MSTILKALKKAQENRDLFVVPKVEVYDLPERPRRKLWPWMLGGLLAANAVFLAAFFWLYAASQSDPSIAQRTDPGVTAAPRVVEPAEQDLSSVEAATIGPPTPTSPTTQTALAAAQPPEELDPPEDTSLPAESRPGSEAMAIPDTDSEPPVTAALPAKPDPATRTSSSFIIDQEMEFAAEKIRTTQPSPIDLETSYEGADVPSPVVMPETEETTADFPAIPTPRAKPLERLAQLAPPKLTEARDAAPADEPLPPLEEPVQVAALPEHAVPDPEAEPAAAPPVEDQLARYAAVPVLRQLPREFRRSVPDLDISIHVYDNDPQWRFVRINKQSFREGEEVAKDLTLEAITPGGLVMVYQGTAFQLAKP